MTRKQYQEGLADRLRQESQSSVLFRLLSGSKQPSGARIWSNTARSQRRGSEYLGILSVASTRPWGPVSFIGGRCCGCWDVWMCQWFSKIWLTWGTNVFCVNHVATCAQLVSDGSKPHLIQDIQYQNQSFVTLRSLFGAVQSSLWWRKNNESHFFLGAVAAGSYTRGWEKWWEMELVWDGRFLKATGKVWLRWF